MKRNAVKTLLLLILFLAFPATELTADPPSGPPPLPGGGHGSGGNQPPGAPIDGGLGILFLLGLAAGGVVRYREGNRPPPGR